MSTKKRVVLTLVAAFVCILAVVVLPFIWHVIGLFMIFSASSREVKKWEMELRKPTIYNPVAHRLALYCQSDQTFIPENLTTSWFPPELSNYDSCSGSVDTNSALIEFGGGFHHYGYKLTLDSAQSTSTSNVWKLVAYSEGSDPTPLTSVSLAVTQQLTRAELESYPAAALDKAADEHPKDEMPFRNRVLLALRFKHPDEAAKLCDKWIAKQPESWLAHFMRAHLRCRLNECDYGANEFSQWVGSHKNFSRCIYLAVFQMRESRTNEALAAVRLSLDQSLAEAQDQDKNSFYLGCNGALIAFKAADYDLCMQMIHKMLPQSGKDKAWHRKILLIDAATQAMKGSFVEAKDAIDKGGQVTDKNSEFSSPGMVASNQALLKAIQRKDTAFIRDPANWIDELDAWYTPFDTDEAGWHNAKVQTPYPASWKSDRIRPESASVRSE